MLRSKAANKKHVETVGAFKHAFAYAHTPPATHTHTHIHVSTHTHAKKERTTIWTSTDRIAN